MRHELKTWPAYFEAVARQEKTFELRRDDRRFMVGDQLLLREWVPDPPEGPRHFGGGMYTGSYVLREITYIVRDAPHFGLMPGFALLAIRPTTP